MENRDSRGLVGSRRTKGWLPSPTEPWRGSILHREGYVAHDWRYAERWPPPGVPLCRFYLRGDGSLTATGPGGAPRSYVYDPRQPIPTLGGRNMLIDAGPRDQRPVQALPNYGLIYRGERLVTKEY